MKVFEILTMVRSALVARTFVAAVVTGLLLMAIFGRQAAKENVHSDFVRFTNYIGPDTKYYPTVNEMMAVVRAKAKPEQILVIVGGNSVLYGVGQKREQVWTKALQDRLGDQYAVVNLAFRGSLVTDGGAVVAEALREEYPRQIYMANAAPTQAPTPDGSLVYRFIFWEAYHKGLLIDDPERDAALESYNTRPPYNEGLVELNLRLRLDRFFYFQDFWNDVTFDRLNTVWGAYFPGVTRFLEPRKVNPDPEPDLLTFPMSSRYIEANNEIEMLNVRGNSMYAFEKDPEGKWQPVAGPWTAFVNGLKGIMPEPLRKRTLILLSRTSPYYTRRLPPDEQERDNLAYERAALLWRESGYEAMDYGSDYTIDDFGDRTHLTWRGGEKLATTVAVKVKEMAAKLEYLQP